jgi:hypothetical protein
LAVDTLVLKRESPKRFQFNGSFQNNAFEGCHFFIKVFTKGKICAKIRVDIYWIAHNYGQNQPYLTTIRQLRNSPPHQKL